MITMSCRVNKNVALCSQVLRDPCVTNDNTLNWIPRRKSCGDVLLFSTMAKLILLLPWTMMVQGNNRINFAIVACVNWWPQKGKHSKRIYFFKSVLIWWTFNETKPCNFIKWLFRGCAWQIWQAVSNIPDTKSLHCLTHWPLGDVAGSNFHYGDVIMDAIASQITSLTIVTQPFIQTQIKENIKAPRHWPLCGEFTGHRRIPRTYGQ